VQPYPGPLPFQANVRWSLRQSLSDSQRKLTYHSRFDANGNTSVINAAGSRTTYTWDIEDHPTLVVLPDGDRNTITYDGDGRRQRFRESGGTDRTFIWDGENIRDEVSSADSLLVVYTLAPRGYGDLIARRASSATRFYHCDALGSIQALTDTSETVTDTREYRAFGETNTSSGSSWNRFWWVGRLGYYAHKDSDDYWVRARVYRPQMGRWVSRDPAQQGINWYSYVANGPLGAVDPSGLKSWWCCNFLIKTCCPPPPPPSIPDSVQALCKLFANGLLSANICSQLGFPLQQICEQLLTGAFVDVFCKPLKKCRHPLACDGGEQECFENFVNPTLCQACCDRHCPEGGQPNNRCGNACEALAEGRP